MKKLCLLVLVLFGCTSATTAVVVCDLQTVAVTALTPVIATQLQCTNSAAISASLNQWGSNANLCKASSTVTSTSTAVSTTPTLSAPLSLNAILCESLSGILVQQLAANEIPAAWGCTATNAVSSLTTLVNQACAKL